MNWRCSLFHTALNETTCFFQEASPLEKIFSNTQTPKYSQSPVENILISFYAKGISVAEIDDELQEIDGYKLSWSAMSIITDEVNPPYLIGKTDL